MAITKTVRKPGQSSKPDKDPPIFSHEYLLRNQADLISSLCLIIMSGLLFKNTRNLASKFCVVQHNTTNLTDPDVQQLYSVGRADVCMTLFYSLMCIAIHAVENEYFWEKIARKLHLSKTRMQEFMDQGSTMPFLMAVVGGAFYVFIKEDILLDMQTMWNNTPALAMPMLLKFYWILVIAFVVHQYPEMYFMRVKKEDMPDKIIGYTSYLVPIAGAYLTGMVYPATVVLVLHCTTEVFRAMADVVDCTGKTEYSQPLYKIWSVSFVVVRNTIAAFSVLTFFKLKSNPDITPLRLYSCSAVLFLSLAMQLYLGWHFIQTILTWRRQRAEVELAQKKADNFWQNKKADNKEAKKARAEKRAAKELAEKED